MQLTEIQIKALKIIKAAAPLRPREFARLMWPDSEGWQHHVKCGGGSHKGGGMYLAGGAYLARLARLGLIRAEYMRTMKSIRTGYYLTGLGLEVLKASETSPNIPS